MDINHKLEKYHQKRNFTITPEPKGGELVNNSKPIFVVQKHKASRLHYDFRIEANGVLKSWAVPKGPSLNPSNKRLAMPTEDHPMEYAEFEGFIPAGEYGGGTMIIWDRGTYELLQENSENKNLDIANAIDAGKVELQLDGNKLKGKFALIRVGKSEKPRWLLIKKNDDCATHEIEITEDQPESILSRKTIEELEKGKGG